MFGRLSYPIGTHPPMSPPEKPKPGIQIQDEHLAEIGRTATTWALLEHQLDLTIWELASVDKRRGACITTEVQSIYGKFRALVALMRERKVSETLVTEVNKF